ncbi:MAG: alpha/beta fold hydrolase, partial [Candidatus Lokiarchaeota archaeon]|nr:alpha/beta fold hydrolase [Candidatus Lokiarchaeota archaeon]MBD3341695.1 alpha/beta fold hydrolase [Candidatus Lokiarchaeota archaeon]
MNSWSKQFFTGKKKNLLIGFLMILSFLILLPNFIKIIGWQIAPSTKNEIVISTISYESEVKSKDHLVVGNLFQPSPKFSDKNYPAIIACHGYLWGIGKEGMNRWCIELARRGFVVLAIDLPGNGMSIGSKNAFPRDDIEPVIIEDGIKYLKKLDFVSKSDIGLLGFSYGGSAVSMSSGILKDDLDATVVMNGITNITHWLIEGILPNRNVEFEVNNDYIEIEKVGTTKVNKKNIKDILKVYGIYRGNEENLKDLIISGTNRLDRKFLKKFDAVEHLDDVNNDSILFIHSKHDETFDDTNQSRLGLEAVLNENKSAYYIKVNDNHA